MGELMNRLKKVLDEQKSNHVDNWVKKYFWKYEVDKNWAKKFNTLSIERRSNIIEKIIEKYNSDKYNDKEYKHGRMPTHDLYNILFEYGKLYGKDVVNEYIKDYEPFIAGAYRIDDIWDVILLMGQGSLIQVFKFNNRKKDCPSMI